MAITRLVSRDVGPNPARLVEVEWGWGHGAGMWILEIEGQTNTLISTRQVWWVGLLLYGEGQHKMSEPS